MPKYLKVFDIEDASVEVPASAALPAMAVMYKRQPIELKALFDWVYKADRIVVPALKSLSERVSRFEPTEGLITLYRGFNPNGFQEDLGINGDEPITIGMKGLYRTSERSFSTSTDLEIAKKFGSVVVRCDVNLNTCEHLHITDTLAFLIAEDQGMSKILSQKEVILFPPVSVNWEVVHVAE